MNENKTNKVNSGADTPGLSSGIQAGLAKAGKTLNKFTKWLKKESLLVIGAVLVIIVTLTVTQATPISRWIAAPSANCLAQGYGNTMVENNGLVYVLFGASSSNFRTFDPATGNCSSTALSNFPSTPTAATKLIVIDNDTLYGTYSSTGYYYHIRDNFWSYYNRSKADDTALPYPIPLPNGSQNSGNSIASYNNELYVLDGNGTTLEKYSPSTNTWTVRASTPGSMGNGAAMIYPGSGDYLYALRGYNTTSFYRYCIQNTGSGCTANTWSTMSSTPGYVNAGGSLAIVGSNLYAFQGGNSKQFWQYDIAGNSWSNLPDQATPDYVAGGAAMTQIGSTIYALQGNLTNKFWSIDMSAPTPSWVEKQAFPENVYPGGALTTDGTYIYATKGKALGNFYRYDPTGNSWTMLESSHTGIGLDDLPVSARGGIAYIPIGPSGTPEIYAVTGRGNSYIEALARYIINTNEWPVYFAPPTYPRGVNYGASAVHPSGSDNIFVLAGYNSNFFWKFLMSRNIFLPITIGKFDTVREIMTWIPGLTGYQGSGSSVTEANGKLYHVLGNSSSSFVEYDPVNNFWQQLPLPPTGISNGGAITTYDDNTLFISDGTDFYKYDIPNKTWFYNNVAKTADGKPVSQLMGDNDYYSTSLNQSFGSHIVEKDGELYIFRGGSGTGFLSYSPIHNRWQTLASLTSTVGDGSSSVIVGDYIYTITGNNSTNFKKYDIAANIWTSIASSPIGTYYGGGSAYPGGDFIYALAGNESTSFMRYCIANTGSGCTTNTWTNLSATLPAPHKVRAGGSMTAFDSTTLYAMAGNSTKNFMRFDITNSPAQGDGTWTDLSAIDPLPEYVTSGGSLTTDGTYLYATRGNYTGTFWRYDPAGTAGSRWTVLQNAPVNIGYQADLLTNCYGSITYSPTLGDIFAIPGNGYGGFNQNSGNGPYLLYRYQLPASSGPPEDDNSWVYFPAIDRAPSNFGYGAALTYPGSEDYIYAFRGNNTTHFWRYSVSENQWKIINQSMLDNSDPVSQGTSSLSQGSGNSIVEVNGVFYVTNGNSLNTFQKYDPSSNSWTSLANAPATFTNGTALTKYDNDNIYAFNGGSSYYWRYHIPSDSWIPFNTGVLANGNPISQQGATQSYGNAIVKANDPATGNPIFFIAAGNNYTFQKYDPSSNSWTNMAQLPSYSAYGSSFLTIGNEIYFKRQSASNFYKYNISENSWTTLTSSPSTTYAGKNLAYPGSGDYIYTIRGYNSNTFYRYSISGNSWTTLTNLPGTTYGGGSMAFLNSNDLYVLAGYGTRNFWKYDVGTGLWDSMVGDQPPFVGTVQAGGSLESDGTYLYATVGGSNNKEFWRYDPAAVLGRRWTRFSATAVGSTGDLPAIMGMSSTSYSRGSITLCDNCAGAGLNEIWAVTGNGVSGYSINDNAGLIFRFRIDPVTCNDATGLNPGTGSSPCLGYNTWIHMPKPSPTPSNLSTGNGAALTYPGGGNLIYALRGAGQTNFWAYDVTTNAWTVLPVAPATVYGGGSLTSYMNAGFPDIYALRGVDTNTFWIYKVTNLSTGAGSWNPLGVPAVKLGTVVSSGGSLTIDNTGTNIYASTGRSTNEIYRYNIAGDTWTNTSPLGAPLALPSPLFMGTSNYNEARAGIAFTATGPSGGPELFAVTGGGNSGSSFASPVFFGGLIFRYPLTSGTNVGTWPISYTPPKQPSSDKTIYYGGALTSADADSIFAFRGGNTDEFWRYDVSANDWNEALPITPATIGAGGSMTYDGNNHIYATRGTANDKSVYKYTINNILSGAGSWSTVTSSLLPVSTSSTVAGGGLSFTADAPSPGDETVWMVPGYGRTLMDNNTTAQLLYRYDAVTDQWPNFAAASKPSTSTLFSAGSDLALSVDSTYIYALRGTEPTYAFGTANWSIENPNFWLYNISTDSWSALTNVLNNTAPKWVYSGGSIAANTTDSNSLFVFTGGSSKDVLKYSISGNSWLAPSNLAFPFPIGTQTNSNDGGEITYSPSTQKLIGTTGTDNTSPYTIYYVDLANRVVPTLYSLLATTDTTFSILVTATDLNDNPINVTQDTNILLSLKSGTGNLGGTSTGIIPNGFSSATISGVTYDTAEDIVITATDVTGSPTLLPFDVAFTVHSPSPTISNISPNTGATMGGTAVTITGTNFTEESTVSFNGTGAPEVIFINSTELQVITPAVNSPTVPNAVDVVVTQPSGQTGTSAGGFSFVAPTISSITPDSGATAGDTTVTITGTNFGPSFYIRQLTLDNPNSALTDYPVSLTIDTASLISTGKMRSDCGDLRVEDEGETAQLNYWIEDRTCNTATTKIWVKIPALPNGTSHIYLTYGNKNLTSHSDGNTVFNFFDDFEQDTLDSTKWTDTTGSPRVYDGKLILKNYEGIYAGNYYIPTSTVWESFADPRTTGRYGNPLKGAGSTSVAWSSYGDASTNIVSINWSSTSLYADTLAGNTYMGSFATGFKPYKIIYRPNDTNQAYFNYNNGALTTVSNADAGDTLHPTLYQYSGNYDSQWEYMFIRPYGGATEPSVVTYGSEVGGDLQVQFQGAMVSFSAQDIELINGSTIRALSPAMPASTVSIIVTNADGRSVTLSGAYTYDTPTITSIVPAAGTTDGGSEITINGTNFAEGGYRKPISITNKSGATLTDQTLYFTLDTASLITGGKLQSACQDIRVKDSDHVIYLDHWIEGCNSDLTHIWIHLDSIPPEGKTIYVHYGNANFASAASADSFFPTVASSNNKLWLKSDYGVSRSGFSVTNWADLSGNSNNVYQAVVAKQPVYNVVTQNGLPAISFDGINSSSTGDYLEKSGFNNLPIGNANRSVFMVNAYDDYYYGGFTYGTNATLQAFGLANSRSSSVGYLLVTGYGTYYQSSTPSIYQGVLLQEAVLNGINLIQWKNGVEILNTASTAFNTATTRIDVGRYISSATYYTDMDLYEILVFDKAVSTTERQEIENYLTLKYDLNNNIQTNTYTGTEEGSGNTFNAYIADIPVLNFTSVAFVDGSTINAITPPHAAGPVDITVVTPDSQLASAIADYTYSAPATISSIDPATGINNQSALSVDVIGTNIAASTEISLTKSGEADIVCRNYTNVTNTTLTCDLDIQYATKGDWSVNIYTPNLTPGAGSTLTDGFTITVAPPTITNLNPPGGSTLGGTEVTITGDYFVYKGGNYTTPINITNSGAEQTDYQVRFTMDTATAIANGKMRSDCGDIRIHPDPDFLTSLPYYIESGCDTSTTIIWTKVPTITASATTTIYVNYGLPNRATESSGDNVFIFFDDFEGGAINLDKWILGGNQNWIIDSVNRYQGLFSSTTPTMSSYQIAEISSKAGSNLISVPTGKSAIIDFYWKVFTYNNYTGYCYVYYCTSASDTTDPNCDYSSGYTNRINGTLDWTHEQSTSAPLSEGVYRFKAGFYRGYYNGTGWLDSVKVRLYSSSVADGVADSEVTAQNSPIVTFDTTDSTEVTYLNSTTITAVAPPHAAGAINVTVTNPDLQSGVSPTQFTYSAPPVVTSIDPVFGETTESTKTVTIYGTDFVDTPTAQLTQFGQSDIDCGASYNFIDSGTDSFQCDFDLTGAHDGNWSVTITNPDQQTATLTDGFAINYPPPTISNVVPDSGPAAGGTSVTITGTNFYEGGDVSTVEYPVSYSSLSPLTDYQVKLTLDTQYLAGGSMRGDCNDIRTFDSDTTTELSHYVQNMSDCGTSTPLNIWVKVPNITNPGKNIYLKFGDPAWTTDTGDAYNTFVNVVPNSIAEWQMDDLSGSTVTDSSSNHNNGTATGTTIVDGLFAKARQFQGSPDYINYGVHSSLNPSGTEAEHTMEAWVKLEATQDSYPTLFNLWEENGTYDKSYLLDLPSQSVRYYVRNAANTAERAAQTGSLGIFDNNWHHIVATNDRVGTSNYLHIYVDGVERASSTGSNYGMRTTLPTINLQMGKQTWSGFQGIHGLVDSVRVYDRALTQTEATDLFNNYGFLDAATGNVLVTKFTASPPTVGAAGSPTGGPPLVTFGGIPANNVVVVNDTTLTANTPAGTGLVAVTVTNADSQSDTLADAFTYIAPPTIISITPDTGHNQETLTGVVIAGTDFSNTPSDPTVTLYIGETALSCGNLTFVNSTTLTCDLDLNGAFTGTYNVVVQNPDTQTGFLPNGFEVTYPQPTITNIDPAIGLVAGGETITITGTYFENGADVDFDGVYSPDVTFIDPTELIIETPAHTIGLKDVTVTNPNTMSITTTNGYEYIDPPIVTGILPATSSNDQAALEVTISGSNFVGPPTAQITRIGETAINCTGIFNFIDGSPDDSFHCYLNIQDAVAGLWNVVVTNSNAQVGSLDDGFEITYAPPTVIAIVNNQVASGSTQQVTVGGTNFYSEDPDFITVDIGTIGAGAQPCTTPNVVTSNSVTCYLPALSAGTYDVTVTTGTGTYTASNLITYFDAPTITDVTPDNGLTIGGTDITITGTNFFGTPTIFMTHTPAEETTATNVIVVNSTTITATTPTSTAGPVDVKVVTEAGNDTLNAGYTYTNPPGDPDASSVEIFGDRIESINTTYYNNNNLSPANAALIKVTAIETLTGNPMVGNDINLSADPANDLLIHTADCSNIYDSTIGSVATTDSYGTACFLVWSTAIPSFFSASTQISATIADIDGYGDIPIAQAVNLDIEQLSITSILNYRFRNDDGTELTATPLGDISTPYYNAQNELPFRLRFGLTRNMPLSGTAVKADEFSPTASADIGDRPLPTPSIDGLSSDRAFPSYALNNLTNTLYIATPNRTDSKARIYKYNLSDLTQTPTFFEIPGTVNFSPPTPDDVQAPIDAGIQMITRMFIDEDNELMYFVLTPYFDDSGLTRIYKVNLQTETVVDVYSELAYSMGSSVDAEIDLSHGFLYVTTSSTIIPNDSILATAVQKISLNQPTEAMTMVGQLILNPLGGLITSSVLDQTNQFLYITTDSPQKIIKIDLDVSDSLPPVKVDEITLVPVPSTSPNEMVGVQASVIDPVAGYAYFASSTDFTHPDYDGTQRAFITKVDIEPARDFEVVSRLSLLPPMPANDYDYNADYVYLPPSFSDKTFYPYASIDLLNGYVFFPVARLNPVRDLATWKLMRIHLATFTRDSIYDEINYTDLDSTTIKGSIFRPETGRGYIVRERADGDILTEFNSTTRQNLKLQSSPNVSPEYCNLASLDSYTWTDVPNADFDLVESTNFTDGDPTSNVTGLLYDNNDYFVPGQLKSTSNTTDRISIGRNQLTEVEYSLQPSLNAAGSYCFRLVDADPAHQNQVGGNPNLIYNVITSDFEAADYNHFVPLTINGVILEKNAINVVEGTTTDSYGIKLATQPTDDVTITINADDIRIVLSPDATPETPTATTLTFTDANWDTFQYVEASAIDNDIIDGTTSELLHHTATSTDPGYNNIIIEPVASIVTDYGATISNVLATVSGTITFTPPGDFSFPSVNSTVNTPNFSPALTVNVTEGRGTALDYVLTLQADQFCRAPGVCIPLTDVYAATSNLVNTFSTFDAAQIGLFLANYLQDGETLDNRDTYVHVDPGQDRPLSAPITLIDSRNIPSGDTTNPLQGSLDFDLNLMIDYANITGLTGGVYSTLLTIDLNANPL